MPDTLDEIAAIRTELRNAERETRRIDAELVQAETQLDDLRRRGESEEFEAMLDRVAALADKRTEVVARLEDRVDRLGDLRDNALDAPEDDLLAALDTDLPIALLPVRLETRFVTDDDGEALLVRVYPDAIHTDSHEPELIESEVSWGTHYWRQTWRAGTRAAIQSARDAASGPDRDALEAELETHDERVFAAWRQLTEQFGTERAAHVVRRLEPTNPEVRPAHPISDDGALPMEPSFPEITVKTDAWTRAPRTELLPDRWVAIGYLDGERVFEERGSPIPDRVATGPGPDPTIPTPDAEGDDSGLPPVDAQMRWLLDFDAALEVGMGVRVSLSDDVATRGLDRLVVLGVKISMTGEEGADRVTALFDAHHYTDGLSFVPPGTPTNDTGDVPTDANTYESSYRVERGDSLVAGEVKTNGSVAARALGIDSAVFAHVEHADGVDGLDARNINTALWSATWGYYLRDMFSGQFSRDRIKQARRHFIDYVRARGPLPTVRVDQQPYGLLPVTDSTQWSGIDETVVSFLTQLREWFLRDGVSSVPRITEESGTTEEFLQLLSMHGASTAYVARHLIGQQFLTLAALEREIALTDVEEWWRQHERRARYAIDRLDDGWEGSLPDYFRFEDKWVRIATSVFLDKALALDGPLVQGETGGVGYIRWLLDASPAQIRDETFSSPYVKPTDSLLYLLLRHATLQEYANATINILVDKNRIDPWQLYEAEIIDIIPDQPTVTVWDLLNQPLDEAVGEPIDGLAEGTRFADALGLITTGVSDRLTEVMDLPPGSTARTLASTTGPALGTGDRTIPSRFVTPFTTALTRYGPASNLSDVGVAFDSDPTAELVRIPHSATDDWSVVYPGPILDLLPRRVYPQIQRPPEFNEFVASLAYLSTRPPETLELLQSETLDLASHRLDAWFTSFATKRLEEVREQRPTGVYVGGYGVVENLRPTGKRSSDGFIHAPSLSHAATAAILRSGYRSHSRTPTGDLLNVDLTSDRARLADYLLDGVRQGQPLGALLGYRFERGLHERSGGNLDQYLPLLRKIAPLAGESLEDEAVPTESDPPSNVVDGLKLHEMGTSIFAHERLPDSGPVREAIEAELTALGDAIDAVRDAVIAESVYQTVLGNPTRAGATLEAIATGEAPPPELSFTESPRGGVAHTHRLLVLFDGSTDGPNAWPMNEYQTRAFAEPTLNAWAGSLLGDPSKIRCRASYLDPETDEPLSPPGTVTVSLAALELSPLDAVAVADRDATPDRSELEGRLACHLLSTRPDGVPAGAGVRLMLERNPTWELDIVSVAEFLELATTVRSLVTNGRAANAADLSIPEAGDVAAPDVTSLTSRANAGVAALDSAHAVLANAVASVEAAVEAATGWGALLDPLREALLRAAHLGVSSAVPTSPAGDTEDDKETLLAQARSVIAELERCQNALDDLEAPVDPAADPVAARDHQLDRFEIVFGEEFRVLPRFSPPNAAALSETFAASDALQGDARAAETWLGRWAHVRDAVRPLRDLFTYRHALGYGDPSLTVGQLPYEEGDRWVAQPAGGDDSASRLSIVAHIPETLETESLTGLFIDEWVETVPSESTTTGVAFHYDDPEARPPQAVLLAVRPDDRDAWDFDTLESTVLESFDLAKLRMVDLETLPGLGQFLPALYLANNPDGDTISTDFGRLVKEVE